MTFTGEKYSGKRSCQLQTVSKLPFQDIVINCMVTKQHCIYLDESSALDPFFRPVFGTETALFAVVDILQLQTE